MLKNFPIIEIRFVCDNNSVAIKKGNNVGTTELTHKLNPNLTLTLIFSSAQVYRVMSASADIQNVSDAWAQSAQNQVAEQRGLAVYSPLG